MLFLTDGASAQSLGDYKTCAILFDGSDDTAVARARDQWRALKEAGHEVTYWKQDDSGKWAQEG